MAFKGKQVMLIIGKDIYKTLSRTSTDTFKFQNISHRYGEQYIDQGSEMYMGDFTGDDVFPDITDVFAFGGIDIDEHYGEYDLLNDVEVHVRYYSKFNQADKDKWIKKGEDVGHPEQVIFRLGWNGRTKRNYEWKDFDY